MLVKLSPWTPTTMAYHLLSTALESLDQRPSNLAAFGSAVSSTLNAFVSFQRFHGAGQMVAERGSLRESRLVNAIELAMERDLNPILRCFLGAANIEGVMAVHRGIHELTTMTVKTELALEGGSMVVKSRTNVPGMLDPSPCKDSHLAAVDIIVSRLPAASLGASELAIHQARWTNVSVSGVADQLGLAFSAAGEVAAAYEADATLGVAELARHLGCHARTLQRELKATGVSANAIRQATMLNGATNLLRSKSSLTAIAHQAGYSDQAHMTRAFVSSCGLPPSLLRKAFAKAGV